MRKHTKSKRQIAFILLIGIGCVLGIVTKATPYHWASWSDGIPWHWVGETTTMELNPDSFPSGSWRDNMVGAMQDWNNVIGSAFTFQWTIQARDVYDHNDGHNAVAFVPHCCGGPIAVTERRTRGTTSELREADILFDANVSWVPSDPNEERDAQTVRVGESFRHVAQHELGHALGLNHEFSIPAIMNAGLIFERLQGDDKNGVRFIYPGNGIDVDLSVTNAVDDGLFIRYVSPPSPSPSYPGGSIQVEYTIENMGTVPLRNVGVGFYLKCSFSDLIQGKCSGNYFLDRSYFDLPVNSTGTFARTLVIPSNVPSGKYSSLDVVIDDTNQFAESDELNNSLPNPWGSFQVELPPTVIPISDQSVYVGNTLIFLVQITDPENDAFTVTTSPLPSGAGFARFFGNVWRFIWTPTFSQIGTYDVTLTATDSYGASHSETVRITVRRKSGGGVMQVISAD